MNSRYVRNTCAVAENRAATPQVLLEREDLMEEIRQLRAAVQIYSYLAEQLQARIGREARHASH